MLSLTRRRATPCTRRAFLQSAVRAGAALAVPTIIPASVLGRNGAVPPSEKIVVGGIGLQHRGMQDLAWLMGQPDVRFVAICDLQRARRLAVKAYVDRQYGNRDCAMYPEIRGFLAARPDLDAVLIATGDRWHATASILAMQAGKDVYTEKPSTMTIAEGQAVVATAKRYARVYQTGTQRLSEANHVFAIELARTGRLGRLHTAYAHIATGVGVELRQDWLPAAAEPPRDAVDWDAWLGPCPWRPYNPAYVAGQWRGFYDFHTSCIGEWGAHTFAQVQAGLDCGGTSAVEYEYVANDSGDGMVTHFANGVKMILSRGNRYWHGSCGERFDGTDGWAAAADGYARPDVSAPALLREYKQVLAAYTARTGRALDHMRNFLDCIKSRELTVANPEVMHRAMSTVHAANICMWLKRSLTYDPAREEFPGDAEANRLRARARREPYVW